MGGETYDRSLDVPGNRQTLGENSRTKSPAILKIRPTSNIHYELPRQIAYARHRTLESQLSG